MKIQNLRIFRRKLICFLIRVKWFFIQFSSSRDRPVPRRQYVLRCCVCEYPVAAIQSLDPPFAIAVIVDNIILALNLHKNIKQKFGDNFHVRRMCVDNRICVVPLERSVHRVIRPISHRMWGAGNSKLPMHIN